MTHVSPSSEDIPDQMGAQLEFIAKSAVTKQEQGKAAFELSICHATRYVSFANPDDALKWLEHSASCGHIDAFIAGKRVFQANKVAIPPSLTIIPDCPGLEDDLIFLDSLTSEEYFSNAVRIFWTKDLRNSALRSLHSKLEVPEMFLERIREMSNTMTSNDFIAIVDKDLLLHRAVVLGSTDATKFLLAHGAAINNARFEGRTPLHIACRCAHLDLIRLLLSHSADASTNDHGNISPIHWLVLLPASEMSDIAQLLIQNGANINSKTRKVSAEVFDCLGLVLHDTPLLWACCCRNSAAVTTLLACGAVGKQFQLEAALSIAAADIVDTLLSKVEDFQTFSEEQAEELFTEVGGGFFRGFQRWIVHGETYKEAHSAVMDTLSRHRIILPNPSNASLTGGRRLSPLCRATVGLNLPLAKQLIKRGADINERLSDIRWTPLHWALKACNASQLPAPTLVISMVEFLLQNGAALDLDEGLPAGHPYHRTRATNPLSYACEERVPAEVIKLIASWAPEKLHEKERGETPLHRLAAISEDTEAVLALVGLGADLNVETNHRPEWGEMTCCHTPLAHAISDGVWEIAELFLDREASTEIGLSGGHRSTILHLLVERASHTVAYGYPRKLLELRLLLQNVLDHPIVQQRQLLEVEDYNGITPLGLAIQLGVPNYVEIFLGWGARAVFPAKGTSLPEFVTSLHEHPPQRVVDDTTKRRGGQRFISEYRDKLAQILSIVKAHIAV